MHRNPRRLFDLPDQPHTWVEFDPEAVWTIQNKNIKSKCGWTPFAGREVTGRVHRVILRGQVVYEDGKISAPPGTGRVVQHA